MRISDWRSDVCSSDLRPVSNDTPVLDDTTPIRTVLGDAADAITPVFEVRIERRTWIISEGGATIELVLDSGEVVAGERTSPICEIELELKQIGRAHVRTPVTNAHLVCRLLLEKKK